MHCGWKAFLILLIAGASFGKPAVTDPSVVRKEQRSRNEEAIATYRELAAKLTKGVAKESEWLEKEKASLQQLTFEGEFTREAVEKYLDKERLRRASALRRLMAKLGADFNNAIDRIRDDAIRQIYYPQSYNKPPDYFADTRLAMTGYAEARDEYFSVATLAEGVPELKPFTVQEFLRFGDEDYRPTWGWGQGNMTDSAFSIQLLRGYVEVLNGNPPMDFFLSDGGVVYFRNQPLSYRPAQLSMTGFVYLKSAFPKEYEAMTERIQSGIEARLLKRKLFILKRQIGEAARSKVRTYGDEDELPLQALDVFPPARSRSGTVWVQDDDGIDVVHEGLTLYDRNGHIANPAVQLSVTATPEAGKVMHVYLRSSDNRLHFSLPSRIFRDSAVKHVVLRSQNDAAAFYVEMWPDRDGQSEDHEIEVFHWTDQSDKADQDIAIPTGARSQRIAVHVSDQDEGDTDSAQVITAFPSWPYIAPPENSPYLTAPFPYPHKEFRPEETKAFTINLDFSRDKSGFFLNSDAGGTLRRAIFQRAANDIAFHIDTTLGKTAAGADSISIVEQEKIYSPDGEVAKKREETLISNRYTFKDFLVYVLGAPNTTVPNARAGKRLKDSKSTGRWDKGKLVSGQVLIEGVAKLENFKFDLNGEQWWNTGWDEEKGDPIDLYSWAVHELLHALGFCPANDIFDGWRNKGTVAEAIVQDYMQHTPVIDRGGHLVDEFDPDSRRGAFGVIDSPMPSRQWLMTKLDMLMLLTLNYGLKPSAVWTTLKMLAGPLHDTRVGQNYERKLEAEGGQPPYTWKQVAGQIPKGLVLDARSGRLVGRALTAGNYHFILRLTDSSLTEKVPIYREFSMLVNK